MIKNVSTYQEEILIYITRFNKANSEAFAMIHEHITILNTYQESSYKSGTHRVNGHFREAEIKDNQCLHSSYSYKPAVCTREQVFLAHVLFYLLK